MANKPSDKKPSKGGRPLLGVKPTLVRLPLGVPERIDVIAGQGQRAEFIRIATVAELERQERERQERERGIEPATPAADRP